jgi:hypothetical protein
MTNCWEIIADNLSKAGWSWACVSAIDSNEQTIWIADAHRDGGKCFIVHGKAEDVFGAEICGCYSTSLCRGAARNRIFLPTPPIVLCNRAREGRFSAVA